MDHHGGGTAKGHKQGRHHDLFHLLFHIRTFSVKNYRQGQHIKNLAAKKVPKQIYFKGPDTKKEEATYDLFFNDHNIHQQTLMAPRQSITC